MTAVEEIFELCGAEKDILSLFDDLEREKSALILCIQTIQP